MRGGYGPQPTDMPLLAPANGSRLFVDWAGTKPGSTSEGRGSSQGSSSAMTSGELRGREAGRPSQGWARSIGGVPNHSSKE